MFCFSRMASILALGTTEIVLVLIGNGEYRVNSPTHGMYRLMMMRSIHMPYQNGMDGVLFNWIIPIGI